MTHYRIFKIKHRHSMPLIDKLAYLGGLLGPVVTVPQLAEIWWYQNASGVSLFSWSAYLVGAFFWFAYGIFHRERPLIFSYGIWVVVDLFVVIGIILY